MEGSKFIVSNQKGESISIYSRTSMARTLMAHSAGLARTIIMAPTQGWKNSLVHRHGECLML